jgi:hypothetical protein
MAVENETTSITNSRGLSSKQFKQSTNKRPDPPELIINPAQLPTHVKIITD